MRNIWRAAAACVLVSVLGAQARALDDGHWRQADAAVERGIAYLRTTQNDDGSWSPQPGPAITALVVSVMLDRPDISSHDPAVEKALTYILGKQKEDGGIHDGILENYNTAICLSALARVKDRPEAAEAIAKGQAFLGKLQWSDQPDPTGRPVDASHPFYGGAGYGSHGRPDMSNTQIMLEGLYDSGLSCDDPVFQRALVFITRCQGTESNKEFGNKIEPDGGFIYATSVDKDQIGVAQSQAGEETVDVAGAAVSRLRTYGSMTYAGFKSYIYANLSRDDPRVVDAYNWIRRNYTVEGNPGMPDNRDDEGYFYYLMTMSRALDAWGATVIETQDGVQRDWANDLIAKLVVTQNADGSWLNTASRWMENDPNLVTAYSLIALQHAME